MTDPTFCGIFFCGPLQSFVVNVRTLIYIFFPLKAYLDLLTLDIEYVFNVLLLLLLMLLRNPYWRINSRAIEWVPLSLSKYNNNININININVNININFIININININITIIQRSSAYSFAVLCSSLWLTFVHYLFLVVVLTKVVSP